MFLSLVYSFLWLHSNSSSLLNGVGTRSIGQPEQGSSEYLWSNAGYPIALISDCVVWVFSIVWAGVLLPLFHTALSWSLAFPLSCAALLWVSVGLSVLGTLELGHRRRIKREKKLNAFLQSAPVSRYLEFCSDATSSGECPVRAAMTTTGAGGVTRPEPPHSFYSHASGLLSSVLPSCASPSASIPSSTSSISSSPQSDPEEIVTCHRVRVLPSTRVLLKPIRHRCVVVVGGDFARSPRMQYHATSLARSGWFDQVTLVGFTEGNALSEALLQAGEGKGGKNKPMRKKKETRRGKEKKRNEETEDEGTEDAEEEYAVWKGKIWKVVVEDGHMPLRSASEEVHDLPPCKRNRTLHQEEGIAQTEGENELKNEASMEGQVEKTSSMDTVAQERRGDTHGPVRNGSVEEEFHSGRGEHRTFPTQKWDTTSFATFTATMKVVPPLPREASPIPSSSSSHEMRRVRFVAPCFLPASAASRAVRALPSFCAYKREEQGCILHTSYLVPSPQPPLWLLRFFFLFPGAWSQRATWVCSAVYRVMYMIYIFFSLLMRSMVIRINVDGQLEVTSCVFFQTPPCIPILVLANYVVRPLAFLYNVSFYYGWIYPASLFTKNDLHGILFTQSPVITSFVETEDEVVTKSKRNGEEITRDECSMKPKGPRACATTPPCRRRPKKVTWAHPFLRSLFVVDWHNFGFTLLDDQRCPKPIKWLYRALELHCCSGDLNITVSRAMQHALHKTFSIPPPRPQRKRKCSSRRSHTTTRAIKGTTPRSLHIRHVYVLYDVAPSFFAPASRASFLKHVAIPISSPHSLRYSSISSSRLFLDRSDVSMPTTPTSPVPIECDASVPPFVSQMQPSPSRSEHRPSLTCSRDGVSSLSASGVRRSCGRKRAERREQQETAEEEEKNEDSAPCTPTASSSFFSLKETSSLKHPLGREKEDSSLLAERLAKNTSYVEGDRTSSVVAHTDENGEEEVTEQDYGLTHTMQRSRRSPRRQEDENGKEAPTTGIVQERAAGKDTQSRSNRTSLPRRRHVNHDEMLHGEAMQWSEKEEKAKEGKLSHEREALYHRKNRQRKWKEVEKKNSTSRTDGSQSTTSTSSIHPYSHPHIEKKIRSNEIPFLTKTGKHTPEKEMEAKQPPICAQEGWGIAPPPAWVWEEWEAQQRHTASHYHNNHYSPGLGSDFNVTEETEEDPCLPATEHRPQRASLHHRRMHEAKEGRKRDSSFSSFSSSSFSSSSSVPHERKASSHHHRHPHQPPPSTSTTATTLPFPFPRSCRNRKGLIVVGSTSWTPDDDYSILVEALQRLDYHLSHQEREAGTETRVSPPIPPYGDRPSPSSWHGPSRPHPGGGGGRNTETPPTPELTPSPLRLPLFSPSLSLNSSMPATTTGTMVNPNMTATRSSSSYHSSSSRASGLLDVWVLITGKGVSRAKFEEQVRTASLSSHVVVSTVYLQSYQQYSMTLGAADIGLCLHKSSSGLDLPMKGVDMLGAGLPVMALDYEAIGELLGGGEEEEEAIEEVERGEEGNEEGEIREYNTHKRKEKNEREGSSLRRKSRNNEDNRRGSSESSRHRPSVSRRREKQSYKLHSPLSSVASTATPSSSPSRDSASHHSDSKDTHKYAVDAEDAVLFLGNDEIGNSGILPHTTRPACPLPSPSRSVATALSSLHLPPLPGRTIKSFPYGWSFQTAGDLEELLSIFVGLPSPFSTIMGTPAGTTSASSRMGKPIPAAGSSYYYSTPLSYTTFASSSSLEFPLPGLPPTSSLIASPEHRSSPTRSTSSSVSSVASSSPPYWRGAGSPSSYPLFTSNPGSTGTLLFHRSLQDISSSQTAIAASHPPHRHHHHRHGKGLEGRPVGGTSVAHSHPSARTEVWGSSYWSPYLLASRWRVRLRRKQKKPLPPHRRDSDGHGPSSHSLYHCHTNGEEHITQHWQTRSERPYCTSGQEPAQGSEEEDAKDTNFAVDPHTGTWDDQWKDVLHPLLEELMVAIHFPFFISS